MSTKTKLKNVIHPDALDAASWDMQTGDNAGGDITITVDAGLTYVKFSGLTAEITALKITGGSALAAGSRIVFDIQQDAAAGDNVTFSSAGADTIVVDAQLTGVQDDRDMIELIWNGTDWVALSAWFKVVDAV